MSKSLVIVESPAKAKTINKYLGSQYIVKSSVGHVRDLPKGGSGEKAKVVSLKGLSPADKLKAQEERRKNANIKRMGIDPYHNWKANYQILPGKEKVVAELKAMAAKADHIYLATDLDREGEAIAWHLREIIGGDDSRFSRVVFNEITKNAVQTAFTKPAKIDYNRVNAQQTRRFLDRVVGFMLSPLLWKKVARGLSAGRVQSVALKLVVEREREIKAFIPKEFWNINADTYANNKAEKLSLSLEKFNNKKIEIDNKQQADKILADLKQHDFVVDLVETKPTKSSPKAPFITSTLQQSASTRLGFGVKKTMMLAQRLYEAGYITYMRTDSTNLSQDALNMVRDYIKTNFTATYLPEKPKFYSSKNNAQEAHEAIRPSDVGCKSNNLANMDNDAAKLYDLIWRQFVACQMSDAKFDATSVTVSNDRYLLKAKGRVMRFDGWLKVLKTNTFSGDEQDLPDLTAGQVLTLEQLNSKQNFTKPPARFNEASLVRELEKQGIGRPSTYATIISTIQDRGYVKVENRRFYAEKIGEIVTDCLGGSFADLISYDFTAKMESNLDKIAAGSLDWIKELDSFYKDFENDLAKAEQEEEQGGMPANKLVPIDIKCPDCGAKMAIRTASTGVFLGCTNYALAPKDRCKKTINLTPEDEFLNILDEDSETKALQSRKRCPVCQTAMDSYIVDGEHKIHICGNNPNCDGYLIEKGKFKLKGYEGPTIECDKCAGEMILKSGRFGKYMGCDNCGNTRKILKNGEVAPPKEDPIAFEELKCEKSDAYFVLRDGASGIFLSAHNFPKSRESRAVKVSELKQFKARLPEKFHYFTSAPEVDKDGNPTIVRFSRKDKSQYIGSEKDGKITKFRLNYDGKSWV